MHPKNLPRDLYSANAGLRWHIDRLLGEGNFVWFNAAHGFGADMARIDQILQADRGKTTSTGVLQLLLHGEALQSQMLTRSAVQGQIAFTNGVQQALLCWRDAVSEAFAGEDEAAPFVNVFRRWAEPWIAAMTATPAEAGTDWREP